MKGEHWRKTILMQTNKGSNNSNNNTLIQFFIIYLPSQQPQGQLQAQHSVDKIIIT
jgi:hypothetical protein